MLLSWKNHLLRLAPGTLLCILIAWVAAGAQRLEIAFMGRPFIESLVLAIVIGGFVRSVLPVGEYVREGIAFSSKTLLEIAVMLLGAAMSAQSLSAVGGKLILGIAVIVVLVISLSYGVSRLLGLNWRLALLVACGNSICGNSAIAAVAPVIGAESEDIVASIGYTAVLGVAVVLFLPLLVPALHLSESQYGILAGLTVYAVPQVIAATAPVALISVQIGTLVKLIRVLMLGPVVVGISLYTAKGNSNLASARPGLVPWFIIGFLALMGLHSANLINPTLLNIADQIATGLTIISMAGLGLSMDVRALLRSGSRVTLAASLSLMLLGLIAFALIRLLAIS